MDIKTEKKRGLAAIFALCPGSHITAAISGAVILLHLLLRDKHELMSRLSRGVVRPIHRVLSSLCSHFRFSLAELLIALLCLNALIYIIVTAVKLVRGGERLKKAYIAVMELVSLVLCIYAGFCVLWGVYYYGDDFATENSLDDSAVTAAELEQVTEYFAGLLCEYGEQVQRDENGLYAPDKIAILNRSSEVFRSAVELYPGLAGPDIDAKGIFFSRVMSYLDFTGFFFPFTAEANVNMDFPAGLFASTVAHELSHQRGVAKEQEANFTAVLASLNYGDADYCYSSCMLAYTHLGNALYSADNEAWKKIYLSLSDEVVSDLRANREYWEQFETPVQTVSNTVYESFLYSYDQELGLRSYGACVNLLVHYYIDDAELRAEVNAERSELDKPPI